MARLVPSGLRQRFGKSVQLRVRPRSRVGKREISRPVATSMVTTSRLDVVEWSRVLSGVKHALWTLAIKLVAMTRGVLFESRSQTYRWYPPSLTRLGSPGLSTNATWRLLGAKTRLQELIGR